MADAVKTINGVALTSVKTVQGIALALVKSWGGITADPYVAEADALFAAMSVAPSDARKTIINTLIVALKANGVWAKCDVIYVLAAHDEQAARLNWKNPGTATLTAINSPTFTTDRGFTGDNATTELRSGVAFSALGNYAQNSAHLSAWVLDTNTNNSQCPIGQSTGTPYAYIMISGGTPQLNSNIHATSSAMVITSFTRNGFFLSNRSGSTAQQCYRNGSSIMSNSTASTGVAGGDLVGLADPVFAAYSSLQTAYLDAGESLDATENTNYYNELNTYMVAVGAV